MDWEKLTTVAQFDGDAGENSNLVLKEVNDFTKPSNSSNFFEDQRHIDDLSSSVKPTTSNSLLIESLIQLLCLLLDADSDSSTASYKAICEQLQSMNLIDDSYSLNEFEEIRGQYQMQIYKIICAARGQDIPIQLPVAGQRPQQVETCWSRYRREFDEIEFIAGGGFGKVYRAQHKLDCIEYAVKQIKINSTTIKLCHLAEVKTIARLNHPNIVQYKAAWLEPEMPRKSNNNLLNAAQKDESTDQRLSLTMDETISENCVSDVTEESSDFIQFERSKIEIKSNKDDESNISYEKQAICKYNSKTLETLRNQKSAILFIQMSLCQLTLRNWLNERNKMNTFEDYYLHFFGPNNDLTHLEIVHDIFFQILTGIDYIHSRNVIHHDIKPSNIFLAVENGKVIAQLGDFGLACPLQDSHRGFAVGTEFYAAPEQLNGDCNPKSDIYSLGIVLLELLLKFETDMERVEVIKKARCGFFPKELSKQSIKLLKSLLSNVKDRPTTKKLLEAVRSVNLENNFRVFEISKMDIKRIRDCHIKEMKNTEEKLKELTFELAKKNKEIEELKRLLNLKIIENSKLQKQIKLYQS